MSDSDAQHIDDIKDWVRSIAADVAAVKAVVTSAETAREARKLAAAALSYLVTRMDLVPDWNETIGIIDDVLVIRMCMDLATAHNVVAHLDDDTRREVGRLTNQVEQMVDFLGDDLFSKLRRHCSRLVEDSVRGRTTPKIVDDAAAREALFAEVDSDLRRMPAATFENPADVAVKIRSYLHHKLS